MFVSDKNFLELCIPSVCYFRKFVKGSWSARVGWEWLGMVLLAPCCHTLSRCSWAQLVGWLVLCSQQNIPGRAHIGASWFKLGFLGNSPSQNLVQGPGISLGVRGNVTSIFISMCMKEEYYQAKRDAVWGHLAYAKIFKDIKLNFPKDRQSYQTLYTYFQVFGNTWMQW